MKPSHISLALLLLIFLCGCLDSIKLTKLQDDGDKNAREGEAAKPILRPEFEKSTHELIAATWKTHQGEPAGGISLWQLFAFLETRLTPEGKARLCERGNIQFQRTCSYGGTFSNHGKPIHALCVKLEKGETLEMDVPETLEGDYISFEKVCRFGFSNGERAVKVCRKVWYIRLCTTVEKIEASEAHLFLQLKDADNLHYIFKQE